MTNIAKIDVRFVRTLGWLCSWCVLWLTAAECKNHDVANFENDPKNTKKAGSKKPQKDAMGRLTRQNQNHQTKPPVNDLNVASLDPFK